MSIAIGQTVAVREGQLDDETGISLSGWSGRVGAIDDAEGLLEIEWDSPTLLAIPEAFLRSLIDDGANFWQYYLAPEEVVTIEARDRPEEAEQARIDLANRYYDYAVYGTPPLTYERLPYGSSLEEHLLPRTPAHWHRRLQAELQLPFAARIAEGAHYGGTAVEVVALDDDTGEQLEYFGVVAIIEPALDEGEYIPLANLEAAEPTTPNGELLRQYARWFQHR